MKIRLIAVIFAGLAVASGKAQTAPAAGSSSAVVAAPVSPSTPATVVPPSNPVAKSKDTLSVDFPDEDIRTILRNVADLFDLNLVVPETLAGRTTIKLRDVTWKQIFQVILTPVGYTYLEDGNIINVVSLDSLQQEPTTTEVFVLNYARASEIRPTIEPLVSAKVGGKVQIDSRSNSLVVTERPSQLTKIRPIIEELDKTTDQVLIESKFVEVTDRDIRNVGVNWTSLQNYRLGVGNIQQSFSRDRTQTQTSGYNNSNILTNGNNTTNSVGTTTTNTTANNNGSTGGTAIQTGTQTLPLFNANGDITGYQQVTFNTNTQNSGTTNTANTGASTVGTNGTSTIGTTGVNGTFGNLSSLANSAATGRLATAVFSADAFNVVLSALASLDNTKVVSNPTVVTLNNTDASINIGQEYPIPHYSYNQERGSFEVQGFDFKPIGIILKVTPQVNSKGFIKLSIQPEVSSITGTTTFGGASGASIPIISTRKAQTQVSLKDGYTMGIGGLLSKTDTHGTTKIPLLGDIPLLGNLFKSKSKDEQTTNLLIFITARTVSADGPPVADTFDPRQIRQMGLKKDELPGYRDGTDPFTDPAPAPHKKK